MELLRSSKRDGDEWHRSVNTNENGHPELFLNTRQKTPSYFPYRRLSAIFSPSVIILRVKTTKGNPRKGRKHAGVSRLYPMY